jgi:hypothetical protein
MGTAVGILSLGDIEAEIRLGIIYPSHLQYVYVPKELEEMG